MGKLTSWLRQLAHLDQEEVIEYDGGNYCIDGTSASGEFATVADALSVPSFQFGVETVANIISSLEIGLFSEKDGKVTEHKADKRVYLLNNETGTYMLSSELIKAMIRDYFTYGESFVYVKRDGFNNIKSLIYLPHGRYALMLDDSDPLNIYAYVQVNEKTLPMEDFIYIHRNTVNGVQGSSLVSECNSLFKSAKDGITYTSGAISAGGIKRGVLQSDRRLSREAIAELRNSWKRLYSGNNDCIVLNEGITYKELQQSANEMQMNDNKQALDTDIRMIMGVFDGMTTSTKPDEYWNIMLQIGVFPIITTLQNAFNRALLNPSEKNKKYFAFDTKGISRINVQQRFENYEKALKNGFMTVNEVRYQEDLDKIEGMDIVRMSLADVLYDVNKKEIYTPNTGQLHADNKNVNNENDPLKGGEEDETRD